MIFKYQLLCDGEIPAEASPLLYGPKYIYNFLLCSVIATQITSVMRNTYRINYPMEKRHDPFITNYWIILYPLSVIYFVL